MIRRKWMGAVLTALALVSCRSDSPKPNATAAGGPEQKAAIVARPGALSKRLVYPWSVVSGGVDSAPAMRTAMRNDPVVEAHFAGLNPGAFRAELLTAKRQGYVSYRIRDKVYWTRRMVTLQVGETVLSDGEFVVRGRCGNLISPTAREPVAPDGVEPAEPAMDIPVREAQLMNFPLLPVEVVAESGGFDNPKQAGNGRGMTVLPPPDPQEMMPPVWTAGGLPSPGGGVIAAIGNAGGAAASGPNSSPPVAALPETPNTGAPFVPGPTPSTTIEVALPLVIAALHAGPQTPITPPSPIPAGQIWEHPWTPNYPPGSTSLPPQAPPAVYVPPWEHPPSITPPPGTPPPPGPPTSDPPSDPPSTGPPPFDPPLSPPPGTPPAGTPVPEPGGWVFLALGLAGLAVGSIRRKF